MNLRNILIFSEHPEKLADFYKKVFQSDPVWIGDGYTVFKTGDIGVTIGPHTKVKGKNSNPERIMLNFEVSDVQKEFDRIKGLGAKVVAEPYHPGDDDSGLIATFLDPDDNIFQLATPMGDMME